MFACPPSVLVVDDDDRVRAVIVNLLEEADFNVGEASSAAAALDLIRHGNFDLAVVDVRLPGGLSGLDLIRRARVDKPRLRCLFISGYSDPIADEPEHDDFVQKPFRPAELLGCVWELLQRAAAGTAVPLASRARAIEMIPK